MTPSTAASRTTPILLALILLLVLPGCATRTVRHSHLKLNLIEIDFVRQVKGFTTETLGHEHPAIISTERLTNILSAIEVEIREGESGVIRQPAFHPEIVARTAEGLANAFAEIGPDQVIGANIIRKEMRIGIFHRKFLTSFLAYMDEGHLYLSMRRVEWPVPKRNEEKRYPRPQADKKVMDFRVVTGDPLYFAGVQDLEIDWTSDVFRKSFRLPGTTSGERRRREVLLQSPVPKDEIDALSKQDVPYSELSPEQLRALADLEEERREGRITETDFQRSKRQLLRKR